MRITVAGTVNKTKCIIPPAISLFYAFKNSQIHDLCNGLPKLFSSQSFSLYQIRFDVILRIREDDNAKVCPSFSLSSEITCELLKLDTNVIPLEIISCLQFIIY
jgi:hypothetical protein